MIFETFAKDELQWLNSLGIGFYNTAKPPVAFKNADSKLIGERVELVNKYTDLDVLDIGTKEFALARPNTKCFATKKDDVKWLVDNKLYRHPFKGATSLTFWNTFQNIADPRLHLSGADEYVFISCPTYNEVAEVRKVDGQFWYFTVNGIVNFMKPFGFEIQEVNWMEKWYIQDNIGTFVFKRTSDLE